MAKKHQWTPPALVVGLQGSRKSCFLVERVIIPAMRAGRRVVTNVPLHLDRMSEAGFPVDNVEKLEDMALLASVPHSVGADIKDHRWHRGVVVVDEAGTLLPAGSGDLTMAHRWARFMAACRHAEITVWLAAQSAEQLAFPLRGVVAQIYHLRNLDTMFGLPFLSRTKLKVVSGWHKDKDLTHPKFSAPALRRSTYKPAARTYRFYDSVDVVDAAAGGDDRRFHPSRLAFALLFVAALPVAGYYLVGHILFPPAARQSQEIYSPSQLEVLGDDEARVYVCSGIAERCGFYIYTRDNI